MCFLLCLFFTFLLNLVCLFSLIGGRGGMEVDMGTWHTAGLVLILALSFATSMTLGKIQILLSTCFLTYKMWIIILYFLGLL